MRAVFFAMSGLIIAYPAAARDLATILNSPPSKTWRTTNGPDLKFCVITSLAGRTGQASTVVDQGTDTLVVVHNWSSPVPGDDVRAIFTIKSDGKIEFRGQKAELIDVVARCDAGDER